MTNFTKTDVFERFGNRILTAPVERLPEMQVFIDAENRLHGIEVAKIMSGRGEPLKRGRRTLEPKHSFRLNKQTCDNSKQGRFT